MFLVKWCCDSCSVTLFCIARFSLWISSTWWINSDSPSGHHWMMQIRDSDAYWIYLLFFSLKLIIKFVSSFIPYIKHAAILVVLNFKSYLKDIISIVHNITEWCKFESLIDAGLLLLVPNPLCSFSHVTETIFLFWICYEIYSFLINRGWSVQLCCHVDWISIAFAGHH